MVTVGHRDFFDINVPQIFLKIWYQCPSSVPPTEHRFYPRMNHHSLHTPYTYILLYCAFSYMKTTLTPNLTLKEKLQEGDMWCPTWLRIWYQVSQSQPQQFDIVPRWLSHCPRKACITITNWQEHLPCWPRRASRASLRGPPAWRRTRSSWRAPARWSSWPPRWFYHSCSS